MTDPTDRDHVHQIARQIAVDLGSYGQPSAGVTVITPPRIHSPGSVGIDEYDRRILDEGLSAATRTRFATEHFADAVEAGVKALCDCIRSRSGRVEDGDSLMTLVFSPNAPILRINAGKSKSDESEQRGHMHLCQGVIGAWRNPRAHSLVDDAPERALMMLETIQSLIVTTQRATRTRQRKKP